MTVAELLSLACYIASLVFLHEFIGKSAPCRGKPVLSGAEVSPALGSGPFVQQEFVAPILLLVSPWD